MNHVNGSKRTPSVERFQLFRTPLRTAAIAAVVVVLLFILPTGSMGANATTYSLTSQQHAGLSLPPPLAHYPVPAASMYGHPPKFVPLLRSPGALFQSLSTNPGTSDLASVSGPSGFSPSPALKGTSTPSNWYVDNYSAEASLIPVGGTTNSFVAGGAAEYDILASPGGTQQFWRDGISAAYLSTDGGQTWTKTYIPGNTTLWRTPTDPHYGDITWGDAVVASNKSGTLLYSTLYLQPCVVFRLQPSQCNSTENYTAPWGEAVSRSTNGGVSWSPAQVVSSARPFDYVSGTTGGVSCAGLVPGNITDKPWLAFNGANNVAVAAWTLFSTSYGAVNCQNLTVAVTGFAIYLQYSLSTNAGVTWGAVQKLTVAGLDAQIAIGPAPTYAIYVAWEDAINATSTTFNIAMRVSTNNGTSFGAQTEVGTSALVNAVSSSYPDKFRNLSLPNLVVDTAASSPHKGALYYVWNDNRTGVYQGYSTIAFIESTNGGGTWSGVQYISTQYPAIPKLTYFQPSIAVSPNGTLWVVYYGENQSTGAYRLYGVFSQTAGSTWSKQFVVSDVDSQPGGLPFIGDYTWVTATSAGTWAAWTDCRVADCASGFDFQVYATELNLLPLTTNGTGITAVVTSFGQSVAVPLNASLAWEYNSTNTVRAPASAIDNATLFWSFAGWSGLSTSTNNQISVHYLGTGGLRAAYNTVPVAHIAGFVSPANAKVTIQGSPVAYSTSNATTSVFNVPVASGTSYWVNASLAKYTPVNQLVGTTPYKTTTVWVNLTKIPGWIAGSISPHVGVTLTVNGTSVPYTAAGGLFNVSRPWGVYWVNASGTGLTKFSQQEQVNPSQTTPVTILLQGGWIAGTITPPNAGTKLPLLTIDGTLENVTFGQFNVSIPGGVHHVVATLAGYNTSSIYVNVMPAVTTFVAITLSNRGWVSGIITPSGALRAAILQVGNTGIGSGLPQSFDRTTGIYNVTEVAGLWTVTVRATGYNTTWGNVTITAGNVTPRNFALNVSPSSGCTGSNCGTTNNSSPPTQAGLSPFVYVGIAVVAVAAVAAAVLLLRRRGGGAAPSEASDEQAALDAQTYDAPMSQVPTLQSDGSLQTEEPPPPPS